jgi:hypothetical protein
MLLRSLRLTEVVRLATQGPLQAVLLSSVFFISDLTSWLSLAIMALLVLRKGLQSVAVVCLALLGMQFLPGLGVRVIDTLVLLTLLMVGQTLRTTVRLDLALMSAAVIGSVLVAMTHIYANHLFAPYMQGIVEFNRVLPEIAKTINESTETYLLRILSVWVVLKVSLILLLARYWQSVLFNPQGFGAEFLALRMSMLVTFGWVIAVLLLQLVPEPMRGLSSGLNLPLLLTGIAVCHWAWTHFAIKTPWRVLFYLLLMIIYPMVILLGVMDSLTDIRQRLTGNSAPKNDN